MPQAPSTARASCEQCGEVGPGCAQFHDVKEPRPEGLHIYVSEDGKDSVVARSPLDAAQVFKEHTGPLPEDAPSPYPRSWVQWDDEAPFDLMVDEHLVPKFEEIGNHTGVFCHGAYGTWTVSAKPSWWVTRNGRGYLGSS